MCADFFERIVRSSKNKKHNTATVKKKTIS